MLFFTSISFVRLLSFLHPKDYDLIRHRARSQNFSSSMKTIIESMHAKDSNSHSYDFFAFKRVRNHDQRCSRPRHRHHYRQYPDPHPLVTSLGARPNHNAQWIVWGSRVAEWAMWSTWVYDDTVLRAHICRRALGKATTLTKYSADSRAFSSHGRSLTRRHLSPDNPSKKRLLALTISHSRSRNKVFCAIFFVPICIMFSLFHEKLRYSSVQEQKLTAAWSMIRDREHKSDAVVLYPATRDALRRSLSIKILSFRFKPYDCDNNRWIHKSRCKSFLRASEQAIDEPRSGDIRGDKASMQKREKKRR